MTLSDYNWRRGFLRVGVFLVIIGLAEIYGLNVASRFATPYTSLSTTTEALVLSLSVIIFAALAVWVALGFRPEKR